MIEGTLLVNLDPPFMAFQPRRCGQSIDRAVDIETEIRCDCTQAQIKDFLVELEVISVTQAWPPRECIMRLATKLPVRILLKHGLLKMPSLEHFIVANTKPLRRIS